eukprot:2684169-Pyramimonas_sp.AAC.1
MGTAHPPLPEKRLASYLLDEGAQQVCHLWGSSFGKPASDSRGALKRAEGRKERKRACARGRVG